jgi:hypothetical protein
MRSLGLYYKIFINVVLSLNTIFNKDIVTLAMIVDIFSNV